MAKQLYKIACGPDCGFLIRSHDQDEVVRTALAHDKGAHKGKATEAEMRKAVEPAQIPAQYTR
jgi:predicted small metal-binding protein